MNRDRRIIKLLHAEDGGLVLYMKRLRAAIARLNTNLAWFMRQMFGRKSEKLSRLDPNQLGLDFEGFNLKLPLQAQASESAAAEIAEISALPTKKKPLNLEQM
ncbi:hypothetical protein ACFO6W_01380 [Dysgonomonas termitidis]|uniref:Transposase TnpC homeodomain domain-containing protein n=1 Tax=Dysgonomonas termitidis TaxID=1516126 RepID=A0ABV9KQL2_9BACT